MDYRTFVDSLAPAERWRMMAAWRRVSRKATNDEAAKICRIAETADSVDWTRLFGGEYLSWICAADGTRMLVWSPAPIHDGCNTGNIKDGEIRVLVQSKEQRFTPAYRTCLVRTISEILGERKKQYRRLSARGKRLYDELRRLYPDLPIAVVEMGGPVIYTALNDFDFEICGGFYGRTIKCFPWRISEDDYPMYTMETIDIPSRDATFAAHKVRAIVEKYQDIEDEHDEETPET